MRVSLKLAAALSVLIPLLLTSSALGAQNPDSSSGFWFLLVRREGKNYYDLSRTAVFLEPHHISEELLRRVQSSPEHLSIIDIIADTTIRYGVYQAWKVRNIGVSDSVKAPASARDSAYVLVYPRNPDWKFCARKYRIESFPNRARKITYTDFQDGKEYVIDLSPSWPRPWQISEIEILSPDAFPEIWQASKQAMDRAH